MIKKLNEEIPDRTLITTNIHKKFGKTFGVDSAQISREKTIVYVREEDRLKFAQGDQISQKQNREQAIQNMRKNSARRRKGKKSNRSNEEEHQIVHEEEEQQAYQAHEQEQIAQKQYAEVHEASAYEPEASANETSENQLQVTTNPHSPSKESVEEGPEPLLFVDVNLGNVSERITVMKGDTAESLTEEFSRKHDLDVNMQHKLKQMLQQQIDGILEKIDEEDHTSQITGEDSQNPVQDDV